MTKTSNHPLNQPFPLNPLRSFHRKLWTSTHLGLESYFPASKRNWCRELVKMEIRNLQSLLVCSMILWRVFSTEDDWIFGWRSRLASQILILCSPFTLFRWMNEAALLMWNSMDLIPADKVLTNTHLDLQKRFPINYVCPKCLAALHCGSAFSSERLKIPPGTRWGGNGTGPLVTWEFPLRIEWASRKSFESFIHLSSSCNSVEGGTLKLL